VALIRCEIQRIERSLTRFLVGMMTRAGLVGMMPGVRILGMLPGVRVVGMMTRAGLVGMTRAGFVGMMPGVRILGMMPGVRGRRLQRGAFGSSLLLDGVKRPDRETTHGSPWGRVHRSSLGFPQLWDGDPLNCVRMRHPSLAGVLGRALTSL